MDIMSKYTYLISNDANRDILMNDIISSNLNIHGNLNILCYHVTNKSGKYPFIQVMLEIQPFFTSINEQFSLPSIQLNHQSSNLATTVINKVKNNLFELGCDPSTLDSDAFIGVINNNSLLLVDISSIDIFRISNTKKNTTWFALPTEIMNTESICNIPIASSVTNLFLSIPKLGMLHNPDDNSMYPLPDAVYTGSHFKKVEYCSVFGMSKRQVYSSCGEYFYFYRIFEDAVREGGWSNNINDTNINDTNINDINNNKLVDNEYGRYVRGGINRYALFPGNYVTHVEKTNRFSLTDDIINGLLGTKDTILIQYENEELDTIMPDLLVKEYESFVPISYHMLNKSILGDKYEVDNQDKYTVL